MTSIYGKILEKIFQRHFSEGTTEFVFERAEMAELAAELDIKLPKNLGDVIYTFRYRRPLPQGIRNQAPEGSDWVITGAGSGRYRFELVDSSISSISPNTNLAVTKIPDSTPGIIREYALSDEQALLAILRYNRLVDIFSGTACYSLQNHLRTHVRGMGQIETDEIYVGVDQRGAHYVYPVQAKSGRDKLGIVQIDQDMRMCHAKFRDLQCRPIGAQFMDDNTIALFEFTKQEGTIRLATEKHYRLVPAHDLSSEELRRYSQLPQ
ncbi:MAG TPA: endonuclease [Acidobacteriota bacterium]|nr:endonuclease [Acidobacteriota bacterium]